MKTRVLTLVYMTINDLNGSFCPDISLFCTLVLTPLQLHWTLAPLLFFRVQGMLLPEYWEVLFYAEANPIFS